MQGTHSETLWKFPMRKSVLRGTAALFLLYSCAVLADGQSGAGEVSLANAGAQNFDTLASSGTSNALPVGWYISEIGSGGAADGSYVSGNGSGNGGNIYSFGTGTDSERALGTLRSNSVAPMIGAKLKNDTGAVIADLLISYTGEQWRIGTINRPDRLDFQYCIGTCTLTSGTWLDADALDFSSPNTTSTAGGLDGNAVGNRSAISGTLVGVNLAVDATLWVRWDDFDPGSNEDGLAIDDVQFGSPVPPEDNPPELSASVPAEGEDFPANGSIELTFNESVAVAGDWFLLDCEESGLFDPSTTEVTGGPLTWYITPETELEEGESCTLTLDPAQITDLDDEPDTLVDPGPITFNVVAPPPNQPPQMIGTVPEDGANNFPAAGDLQAVFNEPVTAATGAFTLQCNVHGTVSLTWNSPDGGRTWNISPGTLLDAGEACTFTLHASLIRDLEDATLAGGDVEIVFTVFQPGDTSAYYQNVNLATTAHLRCSLYHTITTGITRYNYSAALPMLNRYEQDPDDSTKVWEVYRNASYPKQSGGDANYNKEHTWPKTYGFSNESATPHSDLHMLHASDTSFNSHRGSKPYDNCDSGCTADVTIANHGVGGAGGGDNNWYSNTPGNENQRSYEVWDFRKGDMARAVMYMAIRYKGETVLAGRPQEPDLELTDNRSLITSAGSGGKHYMGMLTTLLQWNLFDPPTPREVVRNDLVQEDQHNRNPFIDHYEWATRELFETPMADPCMLNQNAPVAVTDSYPTAPVNTMQTVPAASGVLANDSDVEFDAAGAALTAQLTSNVAHGTLTLNANGGFSYTPETDYCGPDSFTYQASDGTRVSAVTTVSLQVGTDCEVQPELPEIFANGFE